MWLSSYSVLEERVGTRGPTTRQTGDGNESRKAPSQSLHRHLRLELSILAGPFFPPRLALTKHLAVYAEQFPTTEFNGVFYRTCISTMIKRVLHPRTPREFMQICDKESGLRVARPTTAFIEDPKPVREEPRRLPRSD